MKKQFIAIALVLLSVSCKKVSNRTLEKTQIVDQSLAERQLNYPNQPGNPLNPYDSIGYWHNAILEHIHSQLAVTAHYDAESIGNAIACFPGTRINPSVIQQLPGMLAAAETDRLDVFKGRIARSPYTSCARNYLTMIVATIEDTTIASDLNLLKNRIMIIENKADTDFSLPANEKKIVLECASIARYSSWYWPLPPTETSGKLSFKNIIKWIAIITTDTCSLIARETGGGSLVDNAAAAAGESADAGEDVVYSMP
jgi:hypothetical protein